MVSLHHIYMTKRCFFPPKYSPHGPPATVWRAAQVPRCPTRQQWWDWRQAGCFMHQLCETNMRIMRIMRWWRLLLDSHRFTRSKMIVDGYGEYMWIWSCDLFWGVYGMFISSFRKGMFHAEVSSRTPLRRFLRLSKRSGLETSIFYRQFCHVFPMEDFNFTLPCLTSGDLQDLRDYENPPEIGSRCGMLVVDVSCFTESPGCFLYGFDLVTCCGKVKDSSQTTQFNIYWT